MASHALIECLCCGSSELRLILELGCQPPANSYSLSHSEKAKEFPLGLNMCINCWHAQLTYCVDRYELFTNYSYVSGTSDTLNRFFSWFAEALSRAIPPGSRVLELAANDGSLIRHLQMRNFECVGVDPAVNIVDAARAEGLPIHCGYWPEFASSLDGEFDDIICMNVVAHVDDPLAFLSGCKTKLAIDGILLVQPSQARMFENCEFDTIYHEHLSFFNTNSMSELARRAGLKLVETFLVKIHGDSPIYVLQHDDAAQRPSLRPSFRPGDFLLDEDVFEYENQINLYKIETYNNFAAQARQIINDLVKVVNDHQNEGFDVVFVGAAAKAMTVVNAAGISPKFFLDESPLKIGLHAPGCGSLIASLETARKLEKPTIFIISAWNFRYELAAKLRKIGVPLGSKFYAYFPKPGYF